MYVCVFARVRVKSSTAVHVTLGYVTPELTGKFPGYAPFSLGIKYADIPKGDGAVSEVPVFG
eukprot:11043327-Lingulodinium_polyedra.AAC.1